uniref:Mitochondrial inner membrane protein OXA1L n=1 Tax=Sipha flava TaxID=143950 RepID=A0A2S2QSQ0_9HEMI
MFWGLRNMSMLPLESFKYGGLWWFTDITMRDPYFILPIVTVITLGVTLQFSVDTNKFNAAGAGFGKFLKFGIRVLPVVMLPFIVNFPCAVCIYWASTNFISLGQVLFFKIPSVRKYFNIDVIEKVEQSQKVYAENVGELKKSWKNAQIIKEIEKMERLDHMNFRQSNNALPVKTFKYNPEVEGGLKKDD